MTESVPLPTLPAKFHAILRRLPWKTALGLLLAGLLSALLVPWALRHQLTSQQWLPAGTRLQVGAIRFNPLTLRLGLHRISLDRDNGRHLADIRDIDVRLAWRSLWYRLPIIGHLRIIQPRLQLQRLPSGQLDIADLLQPLLAPSQGPLPRFAITDIELRDGRLDLDDQVLQRRHQLDQLQLAIPLLATVAAHGEPELHPRLDLRMDGSPLHVDAVLQPFGAHLRTHARLRLSQTALAAYLPYLPITLPLALTSGSVSGELQLDYDAERQPAQLQLQGQLQVQQLQLQTTAGQPVLNLATADISLTDVDPIQGRYHFGAIQLHQPSIRLQLNPAGHLAWLDAWRAASRPVTPPRPARPAAATPPLDLSIASLKLDQGQAELTLDGHTPPLQLSELQLQLDRLSSLSDQRSPLQASARLASGGTLTLASQLQWLRPAASGQLQISDLRLAPWQTWLPTGSAGHLDLDGRLDGQIEFHLNSQPQLQWRLGRSSLSLRDGRLQHPGSRPIQWQRLDLQLDAWDPARRRIQLQQIHWLGLQLEAYRRHDSLDLLQGWPMGPAAPAQTSSTRPQPAWQWQLDQLQLEQAQLQLHTSDDVTREPLQLNIRQLQLQHLSSAADSLAQLDLDAVTGHRGTITASGQIGLSPQSAQLMLNMDHLDLVPLQDLAPMPLPIRIQSARLSGKGRLDYAGLHQFAFQGDARLTHVHIDDLANGGELLHWSNLQLDGLQLRQQQGQRRIDVRQLGLADFYTRLIVYPDGHSNLQKLLEVPNQIDSTTRVSTTGPAAAATTAGVVSLPTLQVSASPPMQVHIGGVRLLQGQLDYSDDFIKPSFHADISQLHGRIGDFGNLGDGPAQMELSGTLNQNSPVLIEGSIDPLADSAFVDITGSANSVPLPNLSMYSSRYTGYPITSGLLNADVHYILRDGRLKAENHLLISQLTFGPADTSPGVAHLPVKLAIALLKNSRGEIDIKLPVSGSLSDPRFSISDLFWHAMHELIGRAISSPFRLLAGALGQHPGATELSRLSFAAGSASLDAPAIAQLQQLASMLQQRPALILDITGRADPSLDVEGLRAHWVDDAIRNEYHRQHIDATGPMPALDADEYHRLLTKVYHHAGFAKPRNFLGLEKTPADTAMIAAIKAHAQIDSTQLQALASRRALAVSRWMHGRINDSRMMLQAPRITADPAAAGSPQATPATRVDLGLH